ncbi:MAG: glycosyltransferase family 2 protein [Candidatus Omnitrophota bacterium]|nr:glycosyltransferase family 2 protein [Candidatus Omnitrophota bacterium]
MKLSVAVITRDEERNIEGCLDSVKWADEIIVVDGGSSDRTRELARKFTSKVYEIPFQDFSTQKNSALDKTTGDWVFFIDADERVSAELADRLRRVIRDDELGVVYGVRRNNYFLGKPLRFGGSQRDYPIRLFPRGKARFEQPIHERVVSELPTKLLQETLIHLSTPDWDHYRRKLELYTALEAGFLRELGKRRSLVDVIGRPIAKFFHIYLWMFGFLDGWVGLQYAAVSSYYEYLKNRRFRDGDMKVQKE